LQQWSRIGTQNLICAIDGITNEKLPIAPVRGFTAGIFVTYEAKMQFFNVCEINWKISVFEILLEEN
jgi:hypothetical protein